MNGIDWRKYKDSSTPYYAEGQDASGHAYQIRGDDRGWVTLRCNSGSGWRTVGSYSTVVLAKRAALEQMFKYNPITKTTKYVLIGAGVLGIGAIVYTMMSKSTPAASGSTGPSVPGAGATTWTLNANNVGVTTNIHVGDSIVIQLPLTNGVVGYQVMFTGDSPAPLIQGNIDTSNGVMSQSWTASGTGSESISYTPVDAANPPNQLGPPITFPISVSAMPTATGLSALIRRRPPTHSPIRRRP